jgi:TetR/AcrR family tetracycline transcriptional repressor
LHIADADGLEAVSLRRLASILGVTPMALYRHVRDKDHLLDLMAGRLLGELDVSIEGGSTWQEQLRRLGASFLALVAAHPAAPFLLSRPFESPGSRRVSVALLGILARAGFDPREAVPLLQALTGMLLGPAVHRATYAAAASRKAPSGSSEPRDTAAMADGEADWQVDHLPAWAADPDADRLVVELWVAGVEGLAASRARPGSDG